MTVFETQTCTRCGGSGTYSFNLMHGSRCYGCGGGGKQFTKRGAAAREFFLKSQYMPVTELKVGMFLWDDTYGKQARFMPILSIEPYNGGHIVNGKVVPSISINTARGGLVTYADTGTVRAVRDEAHRQSLLAAAIEYQSRLTKAGKLSKRWEAEYN